MLARNFSALHIERLLNMSDLYKRIELLCKTNGVTITEMCRESGASRASISDLKVGRKQNLSAETLLKIASYFGVSVGFLLGTEQKEKRPINSDETLPKNAIMVSCMIPILGTIPAGYPVLACEEILGYAPANVHNPKECFFLRVNGDSMINAGINSGDLVLIRCQSCAEEGQIVACRVNGDEATLKRFRRQGKNIILMPENPNYPPRIVPQSDFDSGYAAIIGIAVQVTRNLL